MNADPAQRRNDERIIVRREYRNFCVEIAESIPACRARDSFLRMAAFWEVDVKLLERTSLCLTEVESSSLRQLCCGAIKTQRGQSPYNSR